MARNYLKGKLPLSETHPHLTPLWGERNTFSPSEVTHGSRKKAWFKCPTINSGHPENEATINDQKKSLNGCTYCKGYKVCESNCLATTNPEMIALWGEKNTFSPREVTQGSNRKAWFKCPVPNSRHPDDIAVISSRCRQGGSCAYCKGFKVCESNCLATTNPEIVPFWGEKNTISPKEVTSGSSKKVWFKCFVPNSGHPENEATISNGIKQGCAYCRGFKACASNGKQHYSFVPYFYKSKKDFQHRINLDDKRRTNCLKEGILLIEIPQFQVVGNLTKCERAVYKTLRVNFDKISEHFPKHLTNMVKNCVF